MTHRHGILTLIKMAQAEAQRQKRPVLAIDITPGHAVLYLRVHPSGQVEEA